jgi:cell division septum initiation protein DivIVA
MAIDDLLNEGPKTFRTRWLGYDRDQVDEEYARLEGQLETACADRDAALATAEDLAGHLEEARSELTEYRMIHAGQSKDNAVSGCIRYLLHVARRKADEIEFEARTRTEKAVHQAEETAGRHARLLDEAEQETQRRLAEASHRAREIVGEALEQSRVMLANLAERQRLLDQWYDAVATTPDMPLPRSPEPTLAEAGQTTDDVSSVPR